MNVSKLLLGLGTVGLAVASAASSYEVVFSQPTWVGTTQLKEGTYKLTVKDGEAKFTSGKTVAEAPATLEKGEHKVSFTEVQTSDSRIKEIRLAGTDQKLVFKSAQGGDTSAAH
jgi:hypothetical protein